VPDGVVATRKREIHDKQPTVANYSFLKCKFMGSERRAAEMKVITKREWKEEEDKGK
jgi:hypothetical protein